MKRIRSTLYPGRRLASCFRLLVCSCVGLCLACHTLGAGDTETGKTETFKLREISVFEVSEGNFLRGQMGPCGNVSESEVKAYPVFKSQKPIYGSVRFGGDTRNPKSGSFYPFAIDESQGTGKGYDRLYFDLNRDLDLSNDPVLQPQARPPEAARQSYSNIKQQVLFDFINLPFEYGEGDNRPVQLLPRLVISIYGREEYPQMSFIRTHVYKGDIKLGGKEFKATLGNDYSIRGRLDEAGTCLILVPKGSSRQIYWWGGDRLNAIHKVEGKFYTFSTSPTGDRLNVQPYAGALGTFAIGAGGRQLKTMTVSGALQSEEHGVPVGGEVQDGSPKAEQQCQIPAGDYRPNYISVQLGRLRLSISDNYHSDGKPRQRAGYPPVYGITVRPDKPYILDFSNKPAVLFASPAKDQRIRTGETLEVKAVLIDAKLDFMIRGLEDITRQQTTDAEGRPLGYSRNVSLDPTVLITRTNGEKVAEGVMPFG